MTDTLTFITDLPSEHAAKHVPNKPTTATERYAKQLRKNPGQWAVIKEYPIDLKGQRAANTLRNFYAKGAKGFGEDFEFAVRTVRKDGKTYVYGRYEPAKTNNAPWYDENDPFKINPKYDTPRRAAKRKEETAELLRPVETPLRPGLETLVGRPGQTNGMTVAVSDYPEDATAEEIKRRSVGMYKPVAAAVWFDLDQRVQHRDNPSSRGKIVSFTVIASGVTYEVLWDGKRASTFVASAFLVKEL